MDVMMFFTKQTNLLPSWKATRGHYDGEEVPRHDLQRGTNYTDAYASTYSSVLTAVYDVKGIAEGDASWYKTRHAQFGEMLREFTVRRGRRQLVRSTC
jgi:hypothetical protein